MDSKDILANAISTSFDGGTYSIKQAARRATDAYTRVANEKFGAQLPYPLPLNFDLHIRKPKAAGEANSSMIVSLNLYMLRENVSDMLNDTIPHEVAHLICYAKFGNKGYPIQGHGAEWRETMRLLGRNPSKFHNFDTSSSIAAHKAHKAALKASKGIVLLPV